MTILYFLQGKRRCSLWKNDGCCQTRGKKQGHRYGKALLRFPGGGDGDKNQMMPMTMPTIMHRMEKAQTYMKLALM